MNLLPRVSGTTRRITAIALTVAALSVQSMAGIGHAAPSHSWGRIYGQLHVAFTAGPDRGEVLDGVVSLEYAPDGDAEGDLKVTPETHSILPGNQYIQVEGQLATASNQEVSHLVFYVGLGQQLVAVASSPYQDLQGQMGRANTQHQTSTVAVVTGPNVGDVASFSLCFGTVNFGVCHGISISNH